MAAVLKAGVLLLVALTLVSCGSTAAGSGAVATPSESPASDLLVRLDQLFSEHAMLVAKESEAAIDRADDYPQYAALLATNSGDLETAFTGAFGHTTAAEIRKAWDGQNSAFVDYAIGVVTHDDAKSKAAITTLTNSAAPRFAALVAHASHLDASAVEPAVKKLALAYKAFIDDDFAHTFDKFFADLHIAYMQSAKLADQLAEQIVVVFPDKFPGDLAVRAASVRATANLLLQERSYLTTMATDALVAGRTEDATSATAALRRNSDAVSKMFAATLGMEPNTLYAELDDQSRLVLTYAGGSSDVRATFLQNAKSFASTAHVPPTYAVDHSEAILKVVDDQLADAASVASDDRAAATSIEPMADSIEG